MVDAPPTAGGLAEVALAVCAGIALAAGVVPDAIRVARRVVFGRRRAAA